ncbi:MAG: hypothetical protein NZ744_11575, partial [Pirellulaceae bacterium]|nr:hypothetical protein [Pirellulaceae bacterium]
HQRIEKEERQAERKRANENSSDYNKQFLNQNRQQGKYDFFYAEQQRIKKEKRNAARKAEAATK